MTNKTYAVTDSESLHYEDGYSIFLKRSDFREKILQKFEVLSKHAFQNRPKLRVLDMGCGNGQMTCRYIKGLKKIVPNIELILHEPAQESLDKAASLLTSEVLSLESVSKVREDVTVDLVIASYVFYHLSSDTVKTLVNMLNPGGVLAIMMGTNDHPFKTHPGLKAISNHGSSDKLYPMLEAIKTENHFKIERHRVETKLNLNGLWSNQSFTQEAELLLSFSLNKNFNELNYSSIEALNEIFASAFKTDEGFLRPIHEIIWIERTK